MYGLAPYILLYYHSSGKLQNNVLNQIYVHNIAQEHEPALQGCYIDRPPSEGSEIADLIIFLTSSIVLFLAWKN